MAVSKTDRLEPASHLRPCAGESVSGDSAILRPLPDGLLVAIVDVLGHGAEAHALAKIIESHLMESEVADLPKAVTGLHDRLKGTRGAAAALCTISSSGEVTYVSVGNTTLRRFGSTETRLVSQDGVLGQRIRTPLRQDLQLVPGDLVVLHTDGVSDRFGMEDYPGILGHEARTIAKNIVQRFGKSYDDATCIAVRYAA